jgi:hypothetical protein
MSKANAEIERSAWRENEGALGCLGLLVVITVIAAISWGAYEELDSAGWIPHNEETIITAQPSWLIGESKECLSYPPFNQAEAYPLGKPVGYAVARMKCDDGPEHQMKIRFFGRMEQPEYASVRWKCTRGEDGFTCYELGGIRTEK